MVLMDGRKIAATRQAKLKTKLAALGPDARPPYLVVVLVGTDPSSIIYVRHKEQACAAVGMKSELVQLPTETTAEELTAVLNKLNADPLVDGILLQFPLPKHLSETEFMGLITPDKDVDGFNYQNQGKLFQGLPTTAPCTPLGILELLKEYELPIKGKNVCLVGASNIVGKPLGMMLLNLGASVDFCHEFTTNLSAHTKQADILISAVGQPGLILKSMVKVGAVVIDVGITKDPNSKKVWGDVDFDQVQAVASYLTPVPGGVGPMTVMMLLENTFSLYQMHEKLT